MKSTLGFNSLLFALFALIVSCAFTVRGQDCLSGVDTLITKIQNGARMCAAASSPQNPCPSECDDYITLAEESPICIVNGTDIYEPLKSAAAGFRKVCPKQTNCQDEIDFNELTSAVAACSRVLDDPSIPTCSEECDRLVVLASALPDCTVDGSSLTDSFKKAASLYLNICPNGANLTPSPAPSDACNFDAAKLQQAAASCVVALPSAVNFCPEECLDFFEVVDDLPDCVGDSADTLKTLADQYRKSCKSTAPSTNPPSSSGPTPAPDSHCLDDFDWQTLGQEVLDCKTTMEAAVSSSCPVECLTVFEKVGNAPVCMVDGEDIFEPLRNTSRKFTALCKQLDDPAPGNSNNGNKDTAPTDAPTDILGRINSATTHQPFALHTLMGFIALFGFFLAF